MTSFATAADYNARASQPIEDEAEIEKLNVKLGDASAKIAAELGAAGINIRAYLNSSVYRSLLVSVTCAMVERSMMTSLPGLKSRQQTAGPYSFTDSFANPTGDLYLLASERRSLGIGGARICSMGYARNRPHCKRRRKRAGDGV